MLRDRGAPWFDDPRLQDDGPWKTNDIIRLGKLYDGFTHLPDHKKGPDGAR